MISLFTWIWALALYSTDFRFSTKLSLKHRVSSLTYQRFPFLLPVNKKGQKKKKKKKKVQDHNWLVVLAEASKAFTSLPLCTEQKVAPDRLGFLLHDTHGPFSVSSTCTTYSMCKGFMVVSRL